MVRVRGEATGWAIFLGMGVFSLFHARAFPVGLIGMGALALTGWAVLLALIGAEDGFAAWAGRFPASHWGGWFLVATAGGVGVACAYRAEIGAPLFPRALGRFALVGALIGASEEWLYRGVVQTSLARGGRWSAAAFAAAGHTAYKCLLFVGRPDSEPEVDLGFLASATFLVGLLLGGLRERSGSVWPAVTAHVTFDLMVYGALDHAPWWVWR